MKTGMTGLFTGLVNTTRAMQYSQFAMNIHNENISRANDPSHTRRELITPSESGGASFGVKRIRDIFIDEQFRTSSAKLGYFSSRQDVMGRVEDIFGDPVDGGLRQSIDQFFDKWQALAENPSDGVARIEVLAAGRVFVQQINSAYSQIEAVEQRANEALVTKVDEVNGLLDTVWQVNSQLAVLGPTAPGGADLRDQRDAALDKLAQLVGAQPQELNDGTVRVMVGSMPAVDGPTKVTLEVVGNPPKLEWKGFSHIPFGGTGTVGGLLSVRSGELDKLKTDIVALAKSIGDAVNSVHGAGQGVDGVSGRPFFEMGTPPFHLANFAVNPDLQPHQVAAGTTPLPSDGSIAREIAAIADKQIMTSTIIPGQLQSPRTFYRNMVGWIGSQTREAINLAEVAKTHQDMNAQQRQSAWGVSLDEEVAQLTLQQKAFAASTRVFNAMDEMLDRLIATVGAR